MVENTLADPVLVNEVWADIDYLIARVEQGTLTRAEVVKLVRQKLENRKP